jgi:hypothetical protein
MNGEVNLEDAVQELGRPIMFYRSLAKLIGIKESLLLCQLIYWTPRGRQDKGKGWIYKSAEEFEEETCLTYREQRRIRAVLVERGLIEEEYNREEHVMYFRVVPGGLNKLRATAEHMTKGHMPNGHMTNGHMTNGQVAHDKTSGGTLPNVSSLDKEYSESTAKSTSTPPTPLIDDTEIPVSVPDGTSPRPAAGEVVKPDPVDLVGMIYGAYPRKEGHGAAITAIEKAIDRIRKGEVPGKPKRADACVYLHERTQCYARSPAGGRADKTKIPHPATWYNQSRYLDDEVNWQFTGNEHERFDKSKTGGNLDAYAAFAAKVTGGAMADDLGRSAPGTAEPFNAEPVLDRARLLRSPRH